MSQMPSDWPEAQVAPLPPPNYPKNISRSVTNIFGYGAHATAGVVPICEDGQAIACHDEVSSESDPLFDAEVVTQCTPTGGSCICTAQIGLSSGLKSIGIKAMGFGLEVSGSLGWSSIESGTYQGDCP